MIVVFIGGLALVIVAMIATLATYRISMSKVDRHTEIIEVTPTAPYMFSIGDRIRLKGNVNDHIGFFIVDIREGYYWCDADITIPLSKQYLFEKYE